jgi:hypothetical protein
MLYGKKKHKKPSRDINYDVPKIALMVALFLCPKLPSLWLFFGKRNAFFALNPLLPGKLFFEFFAQIHSTGVIFD